MAQKPATKLHADNWPPSAAARFLSCPPSRHVVKLYDNDESDASLKGDRAHDMLEDGIRFGLRPDTDDPDVDLAVMGVLEWVKETRMAYGDKCEVFAEQRFDIPETGEWGTGDITFVTPKLLHIADYKNGYVPVEVFLNAQMMMYLLGAIAKYGERQKYFITVLQPNYNHRDGPYRTMEVSHEQVEWYRGEVKYAVNAPDDAFKAGTHCKKTYCPHRGSCLTFISWARTEGADAYFPSDVHAMDDAQLVQALDHADILQGVRDELRKEAMRRMIQMDKQLPGYKIVKSRHDRSFAGEDAREAAFKVCQELGATEADLYAKKPESVAGIERFIKQKFKHFGNGKWQLAWDNNIKQHVRDFSGSLTLERETDGRPAHTRGSEFGAIASTATIPLIV